MVVMWLHCVRLAESAILDKVSYTAYGTCRIFVFCLIGDGVFSTVFLKDVVGKKLLNGSCKMFLLIVEKKSKNIY